MVELDVHLRFDITNNPIGQKIPGQMVRCPDQIPSQRYEKKNSLHLSHVHEYEKKALIQNYKTTAERARSQAIF